MSPNSSMLLIPLLIFHFEAAAVIALVLASVLMASASCWVRTPSLISVFKRGSEVWAWAALVIAAAASAAAPPAIHLLVGFVFPMMVFGCASNYSVIRERH